MSKPIDATKIERIRSATISIISRQGVPNCSVAAIAKEAGVSVGYLYRHYCGKDELINDMWELYYNLINERISSLIADNRGIEYVVEGVVRHIIETADEHEENSRFLIMLLNDFSVKINDRLTERIEELANELMGMLAKSETADTSLAVEDLYFAMIGIPMQYLSQQYSQIISTLHTHRDTEHIVRIALKMIRK